MIMIIIIILFLLFSSCDVYFAFTSDARCLSFVDLLRFFFLRNFNHQFLLLRAILPLTVSSQPPSLLLLCYHEPPPSSCPCLLFRACAIINSPTCPDHNLLYLHFILFLLFIVIIVTFTPNPLFLLSHYLYLVGV